MTMQEIMYEKRERWKGKEICKYKELGKIIDF